MVKKHFVIPKRQRELEKFFLANQKAFVKALTAIRKREKHKKKTTKRGRGLGSTASQLATFGKLQYLKHYGNKDTYETLRPELKYELAMHKSGLARPNLQVAQKKWRARRDKYFD